MSFLFQNNVGCYKFHEITFILLLRHHGIKKMQIMIRHQKDTCYNEEIQHMIS